MSRVSDQHIITYSPKTYQTTFVYFSFNHENYILIFIQSRVQDFESRLFFALRPTISINIANTFYRDEETNKNTMAHYSSLLFLLGCSISVQSTMGSGLRRLNNSNMQQNDSITDGDVISDLAQEVLDINNNRNLRDFTFPYQPNVPSCQGRQAKKMQQIYDRKLAQWESFNPSCYTFTFEKVCFKCAELRPVRVTVVDGTATTDTEPDEDINEIPTMEDLFDQLRNCISDCKDGFIHQCKVKFSKGASGVIAGLYTDGDVAVVDEEYYAYYVRDFQTC